MRVYDGHLHIVSPDRLRYPVDPPGLPGAHWFEAHPCSVVGLIGLMDAAGVTGGVLVQPMGVYRYDNSYAADSAADHADRLGAAAIVDMTKSDRMERLAYWTQERRMGGVRLFDIPLVDPSWLDSPALDDVLAFCSRSHVRVSVATMPGHLDGIARVLRAHPDLVVVVDHCGFVDLHGRPPYAGTAALRSLAELPNLVLKVTCHVLAEPDEPRELVEHLAALVGPQRLVWGSDYAQTYDRPYVELVAQGRSACAGLGTEEQAAFLGGNLLRLWPELSPGENRFWQQPIPPAGVGCCQNG